MKGCLVSECLRSTGFGFLHFRLQSVDAVSFRLKVLDPQALEHCRVWAFGSLCFQVFVRAVGSRVAHHDSMRGLRHVLLGFSIPFVCFVVMSHELPETTRVAQLPNLFPNFPAMRRGKLLLACLKKIQPTGQDEDDDNGE